MNRFPTLFSQVRSPHYDPHDASMARHEDALAKAVLETGDRIGALPPRRLCLVSKTSLLAPQPDRVQLALKQISTIHDDAALCNTMRANISTVCSASAGPQLTPQALATNWGINLELPQGQFKQRPKGAFEQCSTQHCHAVSAQTTDSYDIDDSRSIVSPIHCSRIPPPGATISVHKYLQRRMVGAGHFPWQRNRKRMRDCHCSSSGREPRIQ
jgi:hypothetical protein